MICKKSAGRLRVEIFWLSIPDLLCGTLNIIFLFSRFVKVKISDLPKFDLWIQVKMPALFVSVLYVNSEGQISAMMSERERAYYSMCIYRSKILEMIDFEF